MYKNRYGDMVPGLPNDGRSVLDVEQEKIDRCAVDPIYACETKISDMEQAIRSRRMALESAERDERIARRNAERLRREIGDLEDQVRPQWDALKKLRSDRFLAALNRNANSDFEGAVERNIGNG